MRAAGSASSRSSATGSPPRHDRRDARATTSSSTSPVESKMAAMPPHPGINRGYAPLGSEALSYSLGVEAPRPDLFEAFNIGEVDVHRRPVVRPTRSTSSPPNIWPDVRVRRCSPRSRSTSARLGASRSMMTDVFSVALGLGEHWFRPYVDRSTTTMRVNNYDQRAGDRGPRAGSDAHGRAHRLRRRDGALRRPGTRPRDRRTGRQLVPGRPRRRARSCSTSAISSPSGPTTTGARRSTAWYRHRSTPPARRSAARSRSSSTPTTTP